MKDLRSCETSVNIYQPIQRNIPLYWNLYKRERLETGCAECHKKWMVVELVRNLVAHGDAREGKWRGNRRVEWVASTLTPPLNVVYPALLTLMRTPRLPAVDWTDAPTDLNGLVRFGERRNMVSARVPSRSARAISTLLVFLLSVVDRTGYYLLVTKAVNCQAVTWLRIVGTGRHKPVSDPPTPRFIWGW